MSDCSVRQNTLLERATSVKPVGRQIEWQQLQAMAARHRGDAHLILITGEPASASRGWPKSYPAGGTTKLTMQAPYAAEADDYRLRQD
jgi:hypothetical protein